MNPISHIFYVNLPRQVVEVEVDAKSQNKHRWKQPKRIEEEKEFLALPIDILAFLLRYQILFAYYYLELFCVIGLPTLDKKKLSLNCT